MNTEEKMVLCTRLRIQRNHLENESNIILNRIWELEKEIKDELESQKVKE